MTMFEFIKRHVAFFICVLLALPLTFSSSESAAPLHMGWPQIHSGDEPHYLIAINGLILDGHLDLSSNYAAVHKGANQPGAAFAGAALDHHTVWTENGVRREWFFTYEFSEEDWDYDNEGHPVPRLLPGQSPPMPGHPEYATHPPGLAFLLAPVLFPFRHTSFVEPLAIVCSTVAIIVAMLMFRGFLRKYSTDDRSVDLITAVAFLGTPAWHYGRTLFTEPYLLLFAVGSYAAVLRGNRPLLAGALIGLGMLLKSPFALLIIPVFVMYILERRWHSATLLAVPAMVAAAIILSQNYFEFGSPWTTSLRWIEGSFWVGAAGQLFSPRYGYLFVAPAIVIAFAAWPRFFHAYPRDAIVLASALGLDFVLFSFFGTWSGATFYGARYLVPLLPLVFVSLVKLPEMTLWKVRQLRHVVIAACVLSIVINGLAAMPYWRYWDSNPLFASTRSVLRVIHNRLG